MITIRVVCRSFLAVVAAAQVAFAAQPEPAATAPQAASDKYPADRDYAKEMRALIASRRVNSEYKPGDEREDLWQTLQWQGTQISGLLHYAIELSPTLREWAKTQPEATDDLEVRYVLVEAIRHQGAPASVLDELRVIAKRMDETMKLTLVDDVRKPHLILPPTSPLGPMMKTSSLPILGSSRGLARACELRALLALHDDDDEAFVHFVLEALTAADVLEYAPTILGRLTSHAIRTLMYKAIAHAVVSGSLTSEARRSLAVYFDTPAKQSWYHTIQGERLIVLEAIELCYSDFEAFERVVGDPPAPALRQYILTNLAPRETSLAKTDEYFDLVEKSLDVDPKAANTAFDGVRTFSAFLTDGDERKRFTFLAILLPTLENTITIERFGRTSRGAIAALLAIEAYRETHGQSPESLASLVPDFLPEVPKDWQTPDRRAIAYRVVDPAADPLKRPYLLYSAGADGVDHQGKDDPKDLWRGFRKAGDELDVVYNCTGEREERKAEGER